MTTNFKVLSTEERKDIPSNQFAYTDPDGGKHLPIHDDAHLRNAIARLGQPETLKDWLSASQKKALQAKLQAKLGSKKADHSMIDPNFKKLSRQEFLAMVAKKKSKKDKKGKLIPQDKADHSMVDFAQGISETKFVSKKDRSNAIVKDGLVYRDGLIFRSGNYPDKNFALTPAELKKAAEVFSDSLDIDLEHVPTPLDGKLGQLIAVEANDDGTELHGVVAIPKWLDSILPKHKVSASWDRVTKTLAGLALVRHPRVSDAALMAAFALNEVIEGNATNDDLITMADAIDDATQVVETATSEKIASGVSEETLDPDHNLKFYQELHDVTDCRNIVNYATNSDRTILESVHAMVIDHGATCDMSDRQNSVGLKPSDTTSGKTLRGGTVMGKKLDRVMAALEAEEESENEQADVVNHSVAAPAKPKADTDDVREADEERARLREEVRRLRLQSITERATNFADKLVTEGKVVPAEKDPIVAMHVQLGTDDGFVGTASFSDGSSRVSMFEAIFAARPKHMLDAEAAPKAINELVAFANSMRTVSSVPSDGPMSADRRRALLKLDAVGQGILKDEETRSNGNGRH